MRALRKAIMIVVIILIVVIAITAISLALDWRKLRQNKDDEYDFSQGPDDGIPAPPSEDELDSVVIWDEATDEDGDSGGVALDYLIDAGRINVLLVGIDKRPDIKRAPLSDSIIILSYKQGGTPVLLSIPRDSYVAIPGRGMDKINHSHAYGGVKLLRQTVEEFTKIPIDYYFRVNFAGFEKIVDMLGGVKINVDKKIQHIKPGTQVLNGADALTFCRFRNDSKGDFGRADRQQQFLVAMAKQVQKESLLKLPGLIKQGVKCLDTDMPLLTLLDFANEFSKLDTNAVARHVVTGRGFYHKGVYYSQPRVEAMAEFIIKHLSTFVSVPD